MAMGAIPNAEPSGRRVINKAALFDLIEYDPHPRQVEYHACDARFKAPVCGRRFGKSTMAARDLEPELFLPGRWYWIAAPTYDLGEKEFRVVWNDLIRTLRLGEDKRVKKSYSKRSGDMYIEFPWKTRLEVRSAQHPENLVGEGLHGVILSEAAKHAEDTWERFIQPALSDYLGWATFPTTPEGQNWLYQLWRLGLRREDPTYKDYWCARYPSWENPHVFPGGRQDPEILRIEATTTPQWFAQEYAADFTAFTGKIYGEFQDDTHCTNITYNPKWETYVTFDFGWRSPLAAIEFQVDPWDNIWIFREHYLAEKTLEQHIAILKDREDPVGYHLDLGFGDAADPEACEYISYNYIQCVYDDAAKHNWREGVDLVKTFLQLREVGDADEYGTPLERPKLFVDHSCVNVIREFNNYRGKAAPRSLTNKQSPREEAQKWDDHSLDAIRYAIMHLFKLGARHHLDEVMRYTGNPTYQGNHWSELDSGLLAPVRSEHGRGGSTFVMDKMEF